MVAAVGIAQEGLVAVGVPLDIAVQLFGGPGQANVFGVEVNFGTETTAHIGGDDAHFVLGQTHDEGRHEQALDVRVLVGNVQRVLVVGTAVRANGGTRLHGVGDQTVVDQVKLGHMGRMGKSRIHLGFVTNGPFIAVVVRRFSMHAGCARFLRGAHIDHGRQHVVVHFHELGGIARLLQGFRDHHGHMVAHIANLALGQDRVRRLFHGLAIGAGDQPAARQAVDFVVGNIGANKHIEHARRGFGSSHIDGHDVGMRMR